jgi:hypothetical protein
MKATPRCSVIKSIRCPRFALLSGLVLGCVLAGGADALAGGIVTNCTEANLRAVLSGGGEVVFAVSGSIVLSNTLTISTNTYINASGYQVTISGGNAVRLIQVDTGVALEIQGLTLADGSAVGTHGTDGNTPTAGGDAFGGGLLNQGGIVTLLDCTLSNNVAQGGRAGDVPLPDVGTAAGGSGFGGAIASFGGKLNLTNCVLTANQALGGLGSLGSVSLGGGGGWRASLGWQRSRRGYLWD